MIMRVETDFIRILQVIKKLMNREYSTLPKISFACSDVRDVALAHMRAMMIKQAAGKTLNPVLF